MRILAPSIVDPEFHLGGTGAVLRALARLLAREPLAARTTFVAPRRSRRLHRVRQAASLVRSLGSRLPAKAHFVRTRGLRRQVARRLREEEFDLLLIAGSDLLWLLDELPLRPPTLLVVCNLEYELFGSQIDSLGVGERLRGPLRRDCEKIRRLEERGARAIDAALCVSRDDAEWFRRVRPGLPVLHAPPLFDQPRFETAPRRLDREGLHLGLLGNFEWWPNRTGLAWFLRDVLPRVPPDVRLHLFGHESERMARRIPRVIRHGFVPSLDDVWRTCDFMICPIGEGAGASVKLAETLYHRVPVLARPFAARGLHLAPDPAIVTLESAADWIDFLRSPKARDLAGRRVASPIAEQFSSAAHASAVHALVARAARAVAPTCDLASLDLCGVARSAPRIGS